MKRYHLFYKGSKDSGGGVAVFFIDRQKLIDHISRCLAAPDHGLNDHGDQVIIEVEVEEI